ncbi:acyl-CoA thioesterase [Saliphagus sp. GCM10025308]
MGNYSYEISHPVRYRDMDPMGMVNNAVFATYTEHARMEYFADILDVRLEEVSTVLATLTMDYRRPIEGGGDVTVAMRVDDLGESSMTMAYEIRDEDGVTATAETVQVAVDPETGSSRPLPEEWRRRIEAHEDLDE